MTKCAFPCMAIIISQPIETAKVDSCYMISRIDSKTRATLSLNVAQKFYFLFIQLFVSDCLILRPVALYLKVYL